MSFGTELRKLRLAQGMGVNKLAMDSGVSASQISRFENGKKINPKPETLKKLAKGLKMSPQPLFKAAGINLDNNDDDSKYIDLSEQLADDNKILTWQGHIIPDEDKEYMRRILGGGKKD